MVRLNEAVDGVEERLGEVHEKEKAIHFELIDKLVKSAPVFLFIKVCIAVKLGNAKRAKVQIYQATTGGH